MQLLGNSLTRDEVDSYLRRVEKRITQLEGELLACPAGSSRCRAFLHRELAEAYTIADELRAHEAAAKMTGLIGGMRGGNYGKVS